MIETRTPASIYRFQCPEGHTGTSIRLYAREDGCWCKRCKQSYDTVIDQDSPTSRAVQLEG